MRNPSDVGSAHTGVVYSRPERRPVCRMTVRNQKRRPASFIIAGLEMCLLKVRIASVIGLTCRRKTATTSANSSVPYGRKIRTTKRLDGLRLMGLPLCLATMKCLAPPGFATGPEHRPDLRELGTTLPSEPVG